MTNDQVDFYLNRKGYPKSQSQLIKKQGVLNVSR